MPYLLRAVSYVSPAILNNRTVNPGQILLAKKQSDCLASLVAYANFLTAPSDSDHYSVSTMPPDSLAKIGHGILSHIQASWRFDGNAETQAESYHADITVEIFNSDPRYGCPFERQDSSSIVQVSDDYSVLRKVYDDLREFKANELLK